MSNKLTINYHDRFQIKDQIMKECLESGDPNVAYRIAMVDPVIDLIEGAQLPDATPYKIFSQLEVWQSQGIGFAEVDELACADKDSWYAYIMTDEYFEAKGITQLLSSIRKGSNGQLLLVVIDTGLITKDIGEYFPILVDKRNSNRIIQPYRRYYVKLGEGWGEEFENSPRVIGQQLHPLIYNHWIEAAPEIERRRAAERTLAHKSYLKTHANKK